MNMTSNTSVAPKFTQKVFAVYDVKSETHIGPQVHDARGQAIRSFASAVNGGQGVISTHPEDFTLFEIGEWDKFSGVFKPYDAKQSVVNGLDVKEVQKLTPADLSQNAIDKAVKSLED